MIENTDEIIAAWQKFLAGKDWSKLIEGVEPKQTGCGPVYELANPLARPEEDFAIADMRRLRFAEPHFHPKGNLEIYFVLQGTALIVVGGEERKVGPGDAVVIPPDHAHFTIPDGDFVIAAVNTPPFRPENYIPLNESNPAVHYDAAQFKRLSR